MKKETFYEWIQEQPDDLATPAPLPFLLEWLRQPRTGRMPNASIGNNFTEWSRWVSKKASKPQKKAILTCLSSAWQEWERQRSGIATSGDTVQVRSAVSIFRRQVKSMHENGVVESRDTLAIHEFKGPVAYANVKMGLTHDLGGYESIRIDIGIDVPCYLEELGDAMEVAKVFVDNQVEEEMKKYRKTFRVLRKPETAEEPRAQDVVEKPKEEAKEEPKKEPEKKSKKKSKKKSEEKPAPEPVKEPEEEPQDGEEVEAEYTEEGDVEWEAPETKTDEPLF